MSNTILIQEENSKIYLVPGIFIAAISIPFLIFVSKAGLVLLSVAIILFLFKSGFEIDPQNIRCRGYKSIFGFRLGSWINLKGYTEVLMDFTHERDQDNIYSIREAGSMFQATSFEVFAITNKNKKFLYEFVKYKHAYETLKAFREALNLITHDEFEVHKKKVREKYKKFNS